MILEIGDRVNWSVGEVIIEGVVREDKGEKVEVQTHFIMGQVSRRKIEVEKAVLRIGFISKN